MNKRVIHARKKDQLISNKQYLSLSFPLIIAGISTPLLGAVDTAVVGRLSDAAAIGGVAIGAVIFNTMYWLFGFLRVSTSGFTAQAFGAKDEDELKAAFIRPLLIAWLFGILFVLFQQPILSASLLVFGGTPAVLENAAMYFSIRIWGAPFLLTSYVMIGWLMGMGKVKLSLATQIGMNVINIVLDLVFVFLLDMGVQGVALATVIGEVFAVALGGWIILRTTKSSLLISKDKLLQSDKFREMLIVNRDHLLRTVCLLIMTGIFTASGARMGEEALAANAILLQIHYMIAYLIGGFANASSIFIGKAIGKGNRLEYIRTLQLSAKWGILSAGVLALMMLLFGKAIVPLFTDLIGIQQTTESYLFWMIIYPLTGFVGLMLEGIFSGATTISPVRNTIFLALLFYLVAIWLLPPIYHNHGVWFAFILFSLCRSVFLALYVPKLTSKSFPISSY